MILPTEPREIKNKSPKVLTLFGPSKVGKTSKLTELENALIIDTEDGSSKVKGLIVEASNLNELSEIAKSISENKIYKYIALDTIDNIVTWIENDVCDRYNSKVEKGQIKGGVKVSVVGGIPYGAGYDEVRMKTFKVLNTFKVLGNLIIIGHRKRTIIGSEKLEIKVDSLDLTGKLKGMVMADSDAIGYVFREKDKLRVSFKGDDSLETGSRCEHLANKVIDFDWNEIYIDQ